MIERHATQSDEFIDAAREAECDRDEERWTERLKKLVKQGPEIEPDSL